MQAYEITMLSVCLCPSFQLLNQLTDIHEIRYECCAVRAYPNL
jgi:hypothetical protein